MMVLLFFWGMLFVANSFVFFGANMKKKLCNSLLKASSSWDLHSRKPPPKSLYIPSPSQMFKQTCFFESKKYVAGYVGPPFQIPTPIRFFLSRSRTPDKAAMEDLLLCFLLFSNRARRVYSARSKVMPTVGGSLHVFRQGIRPVYDDPHHVGGGHFVCPSPPVDSESESRSDSSNLCFPYRPPVPQPFFSSMPQHEIQNSSFLRTFSSIQQQFFVLKVWF